MDHRPVKASGLVIVNNALRLLQNTSNLFFLPSIGYYWLWADAAYPMAAAANWTGKLLLWAYPPIVACEAFLDWFFPSTSINRISREPEYITTQRNVVTSMVVAMTVAWGRTGTYYGNAVVGFFLGTFASSLLVGRAPADYEERAQQEQAQAAPQGNSVIVEEVMEDGKIVRL